MSLEKDLIDVLNDVGDEYMIQLEDLIPIYPSQTDREIQTKVAKKKEFAELESSPTEKQPEKRGELFKHQELFKRLMTTVCDSILLMHRTGTGKSCSIAAVAEELKRLYVEQKGHINKVLFLAKGDTISEEFVNQLVKVCTSGYETEAVLRSKTTSERKSKVTREIKPKPGNISRSKQFGYIIENWGAFTNNLHRMKTERFKEDLSGYHKELKKLYSNTLIVVDEAHNIRLGCRSPSLAKGVPDEIKDIDTETPESLLPKEKRNEQTQAETKIYNLLHEMFHVVENCKYILATATPMINDPCDIKAIMNLILPQDNQMPADLDVNLAAQTINPTTESRYTKDDLINWFLGRISYVRELESEVQIENMGTYYEPLKMNVYLSEMVDIQRDSFNQQWQKSGSVRLGQREASIITFPDGSIGTGMSESQKYDRSGFSKYVVEKDGKYKPTPELDVFLKPGDDGNNNLYRLSCKYNVIADLCRDPEKIDGCIFIFSDFEKIGAILQGLTLEYYGYEKYTRESSAFQKVSDSQGREKLVIPSNLTKKPRYALLTLPPTTAVTVFDSAIELLNSRQNAYGDYIKIVIGSPMSKEGINLMNIINIHLVSPWWNPSMTYQAKSRGIRAISHRYLIELRKKRYEARREKFLGDYPQTSEGINKLYDDMKRKMTISPNQIKEKYTGKINSFIVKYGLSKDIIKTGVFTDDDRKKLRLGFLDLMVKWGNAYGLIVERYGNLFSMLPIKWGADFQQLNRSRTFTEVEQRWNDMAEYYFKNLNNEFAIERSQMGKMMMLNPEEYHKQKWKEINIDRYINAEQPENYFIKKYKTWREKIINADQLSKDNTSSFEYFEKALGGDKNAIYNAYLSQYDQENAKVNIKIYNHMAIAFNDNIYNDLHTKYTQSYAFPLPMEILEQEFLNYAPGMVSVTGEPTIRSIDYDMYELSLKKEMSIKRVFRILKVCAVDAYILYNRNYRITDKDGSEICDYSTCDYKNEIVDHTPFVMGSDKSTHRLLFADKVIDKISEKIFQYFTVQPAGVSITYIDLLKYIIRELPDLAASYFTGGGSDRLNDVYYLDFALGKIIDKRPIINTALGYTAYIKVADNIIYSSYEFPVYVFDNDDYQARNYQTTLNVNYLKSLEDYMKENRPVISEEVIERIMNNPTLFEDIINNLNNRDRIDLVEHVLQKWHLLGVEEQYKGIYAAIYNRFLYAIFSFNEPTGDIRNFSEVLQKSKKKEELAESVIKYIPENLRFDGAPIIVHNLHIKDKEKGHGKSGDVRRAANILRILKLQSGERWRNANMAEVGVYQKHIRKELANRYAKFDILKFYGMIIDTPKIKGIDNFYIQEKVPVDKSKTLAGEISKSKAKPGRNCNNFKVPELIDVIAELGIPAPNNIPPLPSYADMNDAIKSSSKKLSDKIISRAEYDQLSNDEIYYYYIWGQLSQQGQDSLCRIIYNKLIESRSMLIEINPMTWT